MDGRACDAVFMCDYISDFGVVASVCAEDIVQRLVIRAVFLEEAKLRECARDVEFNELNAGRLLLDFIPVLFFVVLAQHLELHFSLLFVEVIAF